MAAYTLTSANVTLTTGRPLLGTSLEALTAGMPLYTDGTRGIYGPSVGKADSNASGKQTCIGVALNDVTAAGQPVSYSGTNGDVVNYGAIFAVDDIVIVGSTAGALHVESEITTGWHMMIVGVALTTSALTINLFNSGVAHA